MFLTACDELSELTELHSILSTRKFELDTTNISDFLLYQINEMASYLIPAWIKMEQIDLEFLRCLQEYNKKFCEETIAKAFNDVCETNQLDKALGVFSILIKESYYSIFMVGLNAICNYVVEKRSAVDCSELIEKIKGFIREHDTDKFPTLYRDRMIKTGEMLSS